MGLRIKDHPILGQDLRKGVVSIEVDGRPITAYEGEPIAAALVASGIKTLRKAKITGEQRSVFCARGICTDCVMTVNGIPNIRTCITPVEEGMKIKKQEGLGKWKEESE